MNTALIPFMQGAPAAKSPVTQDSAMLQTQGVSDTRAKLERKGAGDKATLKIHSVLYTKYKIPQLALLTRSLAFHSHALIHASIFLRFVCDN